MEHVVLEFSPTATNVVRGVPNLAFVLLQMHTVLVALTPMRPDIVTNSRKNPLDAW